MAEVGLGYYLSGQSESLPQKGSLPNIEYETKPDLSEDLPGHHSNVAREMYDYLRGVPEEEWSYVHGNTFEELMHEEVIPFDEFPVVMKEAAVSIGEAFDRKGLQVPSDIVKFSKMSQDELELYQVDRFMTDIEIKYLISDMFLLSYSQKKI